MKDTEVIALLKGSQDQRRQAISYLCKKSDVRNSIKAYVLKNSGQIDDVQMVLTDTIMAFAKKVFFDKTFELKSSLEGYLYGIARFKWLDELDKKKKVDSLISSSEIPDLGEEAASLSLLLKSEKANMLSRILQKMKRNCKEILMYWAGAYKMKEIADLLAYKSEGMVRKKKSECMKQVKVYLDDNPEIKLELKS